MAIPTILNGFRFSCAMHIRAISYSQPRFTYDPDGPYEPMNVPDYYREYISGSRNGSPTGYSQESQKYDPIKDPDYYREYISNQYRNARSSNDASTDYSVESKEIIKLRSKIEKLMQDLLQTQRDKVSAEAENCKLREEIEALKRV